MKQKQTCANTNGNQFAWATRKVLNILMSKPKLYVKEGCPWCIDALAYFKTKSMELEIIDVRNDPSRMPELIEISGQSKTPTLQNGDFIVADFDIDEFEEAMSKNPEEAKRLGL